MRQCLCCPKQSRVALRLISRCKSAVTCDISIILQTLWFFVLILTERVETTLIPSTQREKHSFLTAECLQVAGQLNIRSSGSKDQAFFVLPTEWQDLNSSLPSGFVLLQKA